MMKFEWQKIARLAKPCPLCGSRRIVTESKEHFDSIENKSCSYIECLDCGVMIYGEGVTEGTDYNTAQRNVLRMWNRRAS